MTSCSSSMYSCPRRVTSTVAATRWQPSYWQGNATRNRAGSSTGSVSLTGRALSIYVTADRRRGEVGQQGWQLHLRHGRSEVRTPGGVRPGALPPLRLLRGIHSGDDHRGADAVHQRDGITDRTG